MEIRAGRPEDAPAIWAILEPIIRAGETYALPRDMTQKEALACWMGPDRDTFVAAEDGRLFGTYYLRANQLGGGAHVANCGYMTAMEATGRGRKRKPKTVRLTERLEACLGEEPGEQELERLSREQRNDDGGPRLRKCSGRNRR